MSDLSSMTPSERRFYEAGERQERIWVFIVLVLLTVMTIIAMLYVVIDYNLVTKSGGETPVIGQLSPDQAQPEGVAVETGPNAYTVSLVARMWRWAPGPIHVKQGANITFRVTSADVLHGFEVQGTDINLTAVPGEIGVVSHVFRKPGTYYIICNEYCGLMHHAMASPIIVDPARPDAEAAQ